MSGNSGPSQDTKFSQLGESPTLDLLILCCYLRRSRALVCPPLHCSFFDFLLAVFTVQACDSKKGNNVKEVGWVWGGVEVFG